MSKTKDRTWIIYMHKNKINGKVYIGQTQRTLRQRSGKDGFGYAGCQLFYSAIQKYGWDNFEHIVLEDGIISQDEANDREIYYIRLYKANNVDFGYNISSGGSSGEHYYKPVYKYTLDGIFVKKYNSIVEAALDVDGNSANIVACCDGRRNMAFGHQWRREYFENIPPLVLTSRDYHNIPVFSYDLYGNFLQEFQDVYATKTVCNGVFNISKIIACCDGKQASVYGKQWRWDKIDNVGVAFSFDHIHKKICVYRYDKITKEFIDKYESATCACNEIFGCKNDSARRNINSCINGKRNSAYGSIWSYLPPEEFLKTN